MFGWFKLVAERMLITTVSLFSSMYWIGSIVIVTDVLIAGMTIVRVAWGGGVVLTVQFVSAV